MDEIEKALDSGNYEDMYLDVKQDPKKKSDNSIVGYLKSAKHKITEFFKYLFK